MPILTQKRYPYTGNLNPETSGDRKNAFLHCGDVLGVVAVLLLECTTPAVHQLQTLLVICWTNLH